MLIVSNQFLKGVPSWQSSTGKRSPENCVLVEDHVLPAVIQIVQALAGQIAPQNETNIQFSEILVVLKEWAKVTKEEKDAWTKQKSSNAPIFDPSTWGKRAGLRAEVRIYDNPVDLLLAIIGYIRSIQKEKFEVLLSRRILASDLIKGFVLSAAKKVIAALILMKDLPDGVVKREYGQLHKQTSFKVWQASYGKLSTAVNVMVIHDIACWFDDTFGWKSAWTEDATGQAFVKRGFKNKQTMRHNVGTINEDSPWTERARFYNLPVWAGPSGTTETVCRMLVEVGKVNVTELLSCSYVLFAIWASPIYPKNATPIHHLFGVMTGTALYLPVRFHDYAQPGSIYTKLDAFLGPVPIKSKL